MKPLKDTKPLKTMFVPKNGWKNLRICKKCGEMVKEGNPCKKCGTVWEKQ